MEQRSENPVLSRPRVWPVFAAYICALAGILVVGALIVIGATLVNPELKVTDPWLALGATAATEVLLLSIVFVMTRGFDRQRLRLVSGPQTPGPVLVMVLGALALSQALDSIFVLAGLESLAFEMIREVMRSMKGTGLIAALFVIGVFGPVAEELFYRGFMQTRLRERWRPATAIVATSVCFGIMHIDPVQGVFAFFLGLYLGWLTEITGSILPAIACHTANNLTSTVLLSVVDVLPGRGTNIILLGLCASAFAFLLVWLRRRVRRVGSGL